MPAPEMTPVDSSNLESVGYDPASRHLTVRFKPRPRKDGTTDPARTYTHIDVPAEIHRELMTAPSKGRFYSARISGTFPQFKAEPPR